MAHRIDYSAVGCTADGDYVSVQMRGDWMNIQADGFKTVEDAVAHAPVPFGQDERVAVVIVRESVQDFAGGSWHAGRTVARVNREDVEK